MKKITDFIVKGRYIFLAIFTVLAGTCLYLNTKVNINEDIMKYLPKTSETKIGYDIMNEDFSKQDTSVLNVMFKDLSENEKEKTYNELKEVKGVSSVEYENTEEYNKDEYTLYGFKTREEKELFLKLISVKGLGPKMAMPILAVGSIEGIMDAIERENILYLKKFPKIGEKLARQIVLDLKGKLEFIGVGITDDEMSKSEELKEVLLGLGYKEKEIKPIISKVDSSITIEEQVKEALRLLLR